MCFRIRAKYVDGFWKARVFVAPSRDLTMQLTGVLTLSHEQWINFKGMLRLSANIEIIEEREN
jgi:hypothetical protein